MNWKQRYSIVPQAEYSHIIEMTPREILSTHEVNDGEFMNTDSQSDEDFWNKKLKKSKDSGLYDDIKANGVKNPISVIHYKGSDRGVAPQEIFEGHHRLISAYYIAPDKPIPVRIMHDNPYYLKGTTYEHKQF